MSTTSVKGRYQWFITLGLFLFMAVNFADKAVIGLAAAPIMRDLKLSHSEFGRIAGSFFLLFSISGLIGGLIANRVKTRWMLIGMTVIWAVAQAPLLLMATPATLLVSRVILGAAEGPAYPVAMHSLYKWFHDKDRALPSTLLSMGGAFGTGVVAPVVIWIIVTYGWRSAFLAVTIASLVWAAFWLVTGKEGPLDNTSGGHHGGTDASASALPEQIPMIRLALLRTSLGCFAAGFSAYVILTIATIWLPSYLEQTVGYSPARVGTIVALPAMTQIVLTPLLGWLSQRLQSRGLSTRLSRGVLGAALVMSAGLSLVLVTRLDAGPMLMILVMWTFGVPSFAFVSSVMMISEITPPRQRGGMLGLNNCIMTLAGLVTPIVIGYIIDLSPVKADGYRTGLMLAGIFVTLGGLLSALLVQPAADRARLCKQDAGGVLSADMH
ncbi:putative sulfoacetate transporter SauU [Paraburkholderia caffeinitolerans]|uniref:Putative sulfoacetate transporter SauU n=1 Tax=Paraburkholderia caffeinitolerans TaxID=1723730 RepID=A0A6J5FW46_9BURK|nr:MFS transporter [Paraburkholderia caffeinitolerans]CAB3785298.1 putative sulfoacetate transporter SauU [Paraburkholderia caffeinitolerans]